MYSTRIHYYIPFYFYYVYIYNTIIATTKYLKLNKVLGKY